MPFEWNWVLNSPIVVSLYIAGVSSDTNSFIGPYTFEVDKVGGEKNPATDTLGPSLFARTLCLTLLNLSFVISCTQNLTQLESVDINC